MAAWNQKRRDPLTLEERRKNAVQLLVAREDGQEDSLSQAVIGRKFVVTKGVVCQWLEAYKKAGNSLAGLNARKHTGRPPQMTRHDRRRLMKMIEKGAQNYGFETDLWTTERIARLIEEQFKIRYHRDHVGKILPSLTLPGQKQKRAERKRSKKVVRT